MTLQIDAQGRINIPESLRESLHLHSGDHLNARLEDGRIVLEPVVVESNSETTSELLLETNGMLIWTGAIPEGEDLLSQVRNERDRQILGL
jgi:AbrB family looped-hinge helix DNA binding protein